MVKVNGIHHIAVMAGSIKTHVAFFSDVLGCRLAGLFDMHGVPGGIHAFMHLHDRSYFSIVELPGVADIAIALGRTHAGSGALPSAPGTMQHLAFNVDSEADLLAMRDRIRSRGINVIGPIDHGMCTSIYFAGPDRLTLEVACGGGFEPRQWVDPDVCAKAGISAEEMVAYMAPEPYQGEAGAVAQPPYDPDKPHMAYPHDVYMQLLRMSDDAIRAAASYAEPPVRPEQHTA